MFSQINAKSAANSKEKSFSKPPIINELGYTNPQDSIIQNYNVKVNITKKNTKNISIGNLTLNNLTYGKGKELHHLHLTNNKLDTYIQKSEHISPKSSDKIKTNQQFFEEEIKNSNTVLHSPKQSFNKIITKLKREFDKIASRTHSKNNTNEDNTTNTNEEDDQNIKMNNINRVNSKQRKDPVIKPIKNFSKGRKIHPVINANANANANKLTSNITSQKFLLKPHLTHNYSRKPKNRKRDDNHDSINNITANNINAMHISNSNKINDLTTYLNSSIILNTKDITIVDKSPMQICRETSLHINNTYSSSELQTALMAMSNDLCLEKEAHSQTLLELKDSQFAIRLLNEYIKVHQEVYLQEVKKHQAINIYKAESQIIDSHNATINELIKQNKELKGVIYKMLYYIETDYVNNNQSYNKIEVVITQILKENSFLRFMTLNLKSIHNFSGPETQDKDIPDLNKGKNHKRQDTQIVYSSDPDNLIKKEELDYLSHSMKEIKSLKRSMQKEMLLQNTYSNNADDHYWYDMRKKCIFMKKKIHYLRKRK